MEKIKTQLSIALVVSLGLGCVLSLPGTPRTPESLEESIWRCASVSATFHDGDLVGIWQSLYYPGLVTDTLTLRSDGTYQQVYVNERTGYQYTGPWNRWYLEHRRSGGLYLHLEGMRYCLRTDEVCKREGGGGGDGPYRDPCEAQLIWDMGNEVLLIVEGDEGFRHPTIESVPRGIILRHMRSSSERADKFFVLQE